MQALPESVRLQMLDAIGMPAFVPRYQFPLAQPSQVLIAVEPAAQESTASAVLGDVKAANGEPDGRSMAARVLALQTGADAEPTVTQADTEVIPAVEPKADFAALATTLGAEALPDSANLALLEAGRDFFIIDQIPERQVFSKYQTWFLQEVLFAYGLNVASLSDEQLRWPLKNMPALDAPGQALLELLQGKVQALSPDLKAVLILGQELAPFAKALAGSSSADVIYCPLSSAQVMMQPQLKANMWRDLQALKRFAASKT